MLIYGQTEAAAYLSDANSQISGESLEQFAGQIFATITLILAICIATDILHARIPTSKEQLLAMQSPHWGVLTNSFCLLVYAAFHTVVRYVLMLDSQERPTMCLVNALVSNTLIILSLFTFLINTVESARQINFPNTKRTQSMEYKVAGAFIIMITPIGPLAMFRISSTARDNTCVSGLPRDVTMPILGIIAVYHVFAVCRICWPLLRVKHQRIREWGIRSAIGVLLCTLSGTLVFFFVTMKANEYMYHTQILLIVLTCLTFVAIAAHILTWDPPYKSIVRLPRTSMDVEAQIPASKDEQPKCPSCQRSADAGTMISGQDTQTLVSKYQPSRTQSKSILDSKSVAEFLHDEEITQSPERLRIKDIPVWMKKKETSDPPAQAIVPLAVQATSNQPADCQESPLGLRLSTQFYPSSPNWLQLPDHTRLRLVDKIDEHSQPDAVCIRRFEESDASTVEASETTSDDTQSGWEISCRGMPGDLIQGSPHFDQLRNSPTPAMRAAFLSAPAVHSASIRQAGPVK